MGIIPLMILFYKKRGFTYRGPIAPFIWLTALTTVDEFIGTGLLKINTNYWFQLYLLLEFAALCYFFYRLLEHRYSLAYKALLLLFVVFYVAALIFWSDTSKSISWAINKVGFFIFIFTSIFLWFRSLFEKIDVMNLWKHANFHFVSGFFIYYSTTFSLFFLSQIILINGIYFHDFWGVNILATLILRVLLITGVWRMK